MIRRTIVAAAALAVVAGAFSADAAQAQLPEHLRGYPLAPLRPSGDLIAPFFDGWLANPDGSVTYQFGYMNRNTEEVVDIPLGPNNYLEIVHDGHAESAERIRVGTDVIPEYPSFDGVQPTRFYVFNRRGFNGKRERGTFAVTVPDMETEVVWTLSHAGHTYSVPGRATSTAYELSWGTAAFGSLRPAVRFSPTGVEARGAEGPWGEPVTARVGRPVTLAALVQDRGERQGLTDHGRGGGPFVPVRATFVMHQGPAGAEPMFEPATVTVQPYGDSGEGAGQAQWGEASTQATFAEAGEYVVRIRVDNFAAEDSGFDYVCCWSNAYVPVTVR
jgi:hypothetical protein